MPKHERIDTDPFEGDTFSEGAAFEDGVVEQGSECYPYLEPYAPKKSRAKLALKIIGGALVVAILVVLGVCIAWLQDLPDCSDASDFNVVHPTEVYANDHETLLARFQMEYRVPVDSLEDVSSDLINGVIAVEDERFYAHPGVDVISIGRAVLNNFMGKGFEGASTVTQQLVRNTVLADEMTEISLQRKVREAFLALRLERMCSKDEIMLLFLNTVNYGQGAYGIEAASQRYFSKSASELSLAEAALLAGIPQSPVYNNPIDFPDHALARRNVVLDRMATCNYITAEECEEAKAQPIELDVWWDTGDGIIQYPYFASYVRQELYASYDLSTAEIFQGGMKVYTTLDPSMQEAAEAAAREREDSLASDFEVALAAVDPNTGYIKAIVGGKDYYENQYNLATQGARQAGSSFKTFTLVAALEDGISPWTTVNCGSSVKIDDWKVSNIYGINYGQRSIARAFAVSSNTGFARVICAVGPDKVADVAHRMGITSDLPEVPALTLGVGEVTPLEMASAYATLASGGIHYDPVCIEEAYDRKGNLIIDNTEPEGTRVLDEEIAGAAIEVMRGVVESWEGTGTNARLANGQVVAAKTGTSENYKDSWFCGITPQLSVAIWLGDRTNSRSLPSTIYASTVYPSFMDVVLEGQDPVSFFSADEPTYSRYFSNADLGLSLSSSSEKDEEEKKKEEEEQKKKEEEEAAAAAAASSSASSGAAGESLSGGTGAGGGDAGGGTGAGGGDAGGGAGGAGGGDSGGGTGAGGGDAGGGAGGAGGSSSGGDPSTPDVPNP